MHSKQVVGAAVHPPDVHKPDVPKPEVTKPEVTKPEVTVVIPTRHESDTVAELLLQLDHALGAINAEVVFVDDSDDDTPGAIRAAAELVPRAVRVIHRGLNDRAGGLGGAVTAGLRSANAPWVVVMDGDLQHPPGTVVELLQTAWYNEVDVVYATRYDDQGSSAGLGGRFRRRVSASSNSVSKALFPLRLRGVSDPMSGFFAVRVAALDLEKLRPHGFKILLQILVTQAVRSKGVPFAFQPRFAGKSKASATEGMRFLGQLAAARLGVAPSRLARLIGFLAVGLTGVGVNTAALWALTSGFARLPYLVASVLATQVAIVSNFLLLEWLVFAKARARSAGRAFGRFWLVNMVLLPVQLGLLALLVEVFGTTPVLGNVFALGIVFILRYAATSGWVYQWNPALSLTPGSDGGETAATRSIVHPDAIADIETTAPTYVFAEVGATTAPDANDIRRRRVRSFASGSMFGTPAALTLAAVPGAARHAWATLTSGGIAAVELLVGAACVVLLTMAKSRPAPGEPDVHDRQLDVILTVPFLAAAVWFALDWPQNWRSGATWTVPAVLAVVTFGFAVSFVLLGTRTTARLRWALLIPLALLPEFQRQSWSAVATTAVIVVLTAYTLVRVRQRRRAWTRTSAQPHLPALVPPWRSAAIVVTVVALLLGGFTVHRYSPSGSSVGAPASIGSAR